MGVFGVFGRLYFGYHFWCVWAASVRFVTCFCCVSKVFGRRAFISISVVMCRYIDVTQGHGTRPLYAGYRRLCEVRRSRLFADEARWRLGADCRGSQCGSID